jgi:hypothetical protein
MGLKVNYIIKKPKGKMTFQILDIFTQDGTQYFLLENRNNGKVYPSKVESNWQYYGRVYDTIKPKKRIDNFKFK